MKFISLFLLIGLIGCASKPSGPAGATVPEQPTVADAKLIAGLASLELSDSKKGRRVLQEVSTVLDVFCNQKQADSLALVSLLRGKLKGFDNRKRVGQLLLLLDVAGAEINPSDYVQWGNLGCRVREGIKYGLAFSE